MSHCERSEAIQFLGLATMDRHAPLGLAMTALGWIAAPFDRRKPLWDVIDDHGA